MTKLSFYENSHTTGSRLHVMNFLNEIANRFPSAISFASGRPSETGFNLDEWLGLISTFNQYSSKNTHTSIESISNLLAQYGNTKGIINNLIAEQLLIDEGLNCTGEKILVTSGCQEALELCIKTLCGEQDVILVRSPTYIGITGAADFNNIEIQSFSSGSKGRSRTLSDELSHVTSKLKETGKRSRLLYLVPDFDNPTGEVLSKTEREEIIQFCYENDIIILEDNPYGVFRYEGEKVPTMYSLDKWGCVIYLGTYSKTICPSLRVGFAALPKALHGEVDNTTSLLNALSQAKSFNTVNTSQITQAIVGGILLKEKRSLSRLTAPLLNLYKTNRDLMLDSLGINLKNYSEKVCWNRPEGGFFLVVKLPFKFGLAEAEVCAKEYGVLCMPLSFFSLDNEQDYSVRLAFSNVKTELIPEGINRLSNFIIDRLTQSDMEVKYHA